MMPLGAGRVLFHIGAAATVAPVPLATGSHSSNLGPKGTGPAPGRSPGRPGGVNSPPSRAGRRTRDSECRDRNLKESLSWAEPRPRPLPLQGLRDGPESRPGHGPRAAAARLRREPLRQAAGGRAAGSNPGLRPCPANGPLTGSPGRRQLTRTVAGRPARAGCGGPVSLWKGGRRPDRGLEPQDETGGRGQ